MLFGELQTIETKDGEKIPAIPIAIPMYQAPAKTAVFRMPSSEETAAYVASLRTLVQRFGRGQSTEKLQPNPEGERRLFDAIRLDKSGIEFDEAEIKKSCELVLHAYTGPYEREGDTYIIKVISCWGNTVHRLRMPLTRELQDYRENAVKTRQLPHNIEQNRFPPEVSAALYDAVILSVDGYSPKFNVPIGTTNGDRHTIEGAELKAFLPRIPAHHKRYVAGELSRALYDLDPEVDPNE